MNWISVSDRLPEHEQRVIYYFKPVGVHSGRYDATADTFYGPSGFLGGDVTHWMALPEPPKE